MILCELIEYLEKENPKQKVKMGFHKPHSYRGIYADLAFEPKENTTVGEMLDCARDALNSTYQGWKGGEFTMVEGVDVYVAEEGSSGDSQTIGKLLLDFMLGKI